MLSGTPTAAGNLTFDVTVTDAGNFTATRTYTLGIAPLTLAVTPSSVPTATVGLAYNQTISASGGTAPYSYAVTAGSLPAGLTLNAATGIISARRH